jgi:hypothetical protein
MIGVYFGSKRVEKGTVMPQSPVKGIDILSLDTIPMPSLNNYNIRIIYDLKIYDDFRYNYISKYARYVGVDGMHSAIYEHKVRGRYPCFIRGKYSKFIMHNIPGMKDYLEPCSDNYIIFINYLNNDSLNSCYIRFENPSNGFIPEILYTVGAETFFLETNIDSAYIKLIFPELKCRITYKKYAAIKLDYSKSIPKLDFFDEVKFIDANAYSKP